MKFSSLAITSPSFNKSFSVAASHSIAALVDVRPAPNSVPIHAAEIKVTTKVSEVQRLHIQEGATKLDCLDIKEHGVGEAEHIPSPPAPPPSPPSPPPAAVHAQVIKVTTKVSEIQRVHTYRKVKTEYCMWTGN